MTTKMSSQKNRLTPMTRNTHTKCVCVCVYLDLRLTSARIIFNEKLVQRHPASSNSHHHRAAQNPDQTQLLGVSELKEEEEEKVKKKIQRESNHYIRNSNLICFMQEQKNDHMHSQNLDAPIS